MATATDEAGCTALHKAATYGFISMVKIILEYDRTAAYVARKDDKMTALHFAAAEGNLDVIKELISQFPDCCELVDHNCQNVLHYAFQNNQDEIVDFFSTDPWLSNILLNGRDLGGNTPLHHMAKYLNGWFMNNYIDNDTVDVLAFNKENLNAIDLILANEEDTSKSLDQVRITF